MSVELTTLPDGRVFPTHEGEVLSWSIGLYFTWGEKAKGYPRLRSVVRAMKQERPEQLRREMYDLFRSCADRMFGHNAKECLAVLREESGWQM